MIRTTFAATLAALLTTTSAFAEDITAGALTLSDAFAFETPRMARAGGGFVTITNSGESADRLIGVEADYPKVEVHTTIMDNGRAMMRPAGELDVPPGGTLALEPGGFHIMFMGLDDDTRFEIGDRIEATLVFETAGKVEVTFEVRARDGMGHGMGHGNAHGMGQGDG